MLSFLIYLLLVYFSVGAIVGLVAVGFTKREESVYVENTFFDYLVVFILSVFLWPYMLSELYRN